MPSCPKWYHRSTDSNLLWILSCRPLITNTVSSTTEAVIRNLVVGLLVKLGRVQVGRGVGDLGGVELEKDSRRL